MKKRIHPTNEDLLAWGLFAWLDIETFETPKEIKDWIEDFNTINKFHVYKMLYDDYQDFRIKFVKPVEYCDGETLC